MSPWMAVGLLLACLAPAPARGQATDVIDSIEAEQEHLTKGELLYGSKWVHISDLFDEYSQGRKEGQIIIDKGRTVIGRLQELQKQVLGARAAEEAKERTTREEFNRARLRQAECKRTLAYALPAEPKPSPVPAEPEASAYADTDAFNKAHKDWDQKRAAADRDLRRRQDQYEKDVQRIRQNQAQAAKDSKTADETAAKCEAALQTMQAEFQTAQEPLLRQHAAVSQEAQTIGRQANVLLSRMTIMGNILRKAPEGLRLQCGILEWEGLFRPPSDIQSIYDNLKTEIEQARQKAKADASAQGHSLATDWHHPREKDLEKLRVMIERCQAAQAAPLYPPKGADKKDTPPKEAPKKDAPAKDSPKKETPAK
jgi:hypothetical protein